MLGCFWRLQFLLGLSLRKEHQGCGDVHSVGAEVAHALVGLLEEKSCFAEQLLGCAMTDIQPDDPRK